MLTSLLLCLIVGINDGDTLTARCPTGDAAHPYQQVKVRLAEIDAPESGQPFGRRSKEHLSMLCFKAEATIRQTATDRWGRMVARVQCRGVDANLEQVRAGMAWAFMGVETPGSVSIYAPAATPKAILDKLEAAIRSGMEHEETKRKLLDMGMTTNYVSSRELAEQLIAERKLYGDIIRTAKIEQQ